MYLDAEVSIYQVTKNLFNFTLRIYNEAGEEVRFKRIERVSWSTGMGLTRAAFLATRASLGAKNRLQDENGDDKFQQELPF